MTTEIDPKDTNIFRMTNDLAALKAEQQQIQYKIDQLTGEINRYNERRFRVELAELCNKHDLRIHSDGDMWVEPLRMGTVNADNVLESVE